MLQIVKPGSSYLLAISISIVLSELLGVSGFRERMDLDGNQFGFYVISAAPEEVIQSALEGIVPEDHIFGTRFRYDANTGEIQSIVPVPAGYGKVVVLEELRAKHPISHDRIVYVGDGSSDVHVMLHVNRLDGLTIAVSENKFINQIARRTILSNGALSVLVPILGCGGYLGHLRVRNRCMADCSRQCNRGSRGRLYIHPVVGQTVEFCRLSAGAKRPTRPTRARLTPEANLLCSYPNALPTLLCRHVSRLGAGGRR